MWCLRKINKIKREKWCLKLHLQKKFQKKACRKVKKYLKQCPRKGLSKLRKQY